MRSLAIGRASIGFYGPMTCLRREFKQWPGLQGALASPRLLRVPNSICPCHALQMIGRERPARSSALASSVEVEDVSAGRVEGGSPQAPASGRLPKSGFRHACPSSFDIGVRGWPIEKPSFDV
jgi:hypothetical protein